MARLVWSVGVGVELLIPVESAIRHPRTGGRFHPSVGRYPSRLRAVAKLAFWKSLQPTARSAQLASKGPASLTQNHRAALIENCLKGRAARCGRSHQRRFPCLC